MNIKNYGLIHDKFEIDHYILGSNKIGTVVINPTGNWLKSLPEKEYQNIRGLETYNCGSFATLNSDEGLELFKFFVVSNYSDRFLGIMAGTKVGGNSPHVVAEAIRKYGLIPESELPFSDDIKTIDEYYSFKGADKERCINLGKEWLKKWDFKHEWVFNGGSVKEKNALISQALKRSPVGMSVAAWNVPDAEGVYSKEWTDNHWVCCYGETENAWLIFDSYDGIHKKYSKTSDIAMAKLYWIEKKLIPEPKTFLEYINWIFSLIFPKKEVPMDKVEEISPDVPQVEITPTKTDLSIGLFCIQIQNYEGYAQGTRAYRNCNPGNLKYRKGMLLATGQDKDGFAIFATYKDGFQALRNKVLDACTGKSTVYFPTDTILQFFQKYAPASDNNNPTAYATYVAKGMKTTISFQIKDLVV